MISNNRLYISTQRLQNPVLDFVYFDVAKLERLSSGHVEIMTDTIHAFVSFMPEMLGDLEKHMQLHEAPATGKLLHKIKASAMMFGKADMLDKILELERNVAHVDSPEYAAQVKRLIREISSLVNEADTYVKLLD